MQQLIHFSAACVAIAMIAPVLANDESAAKVIPADRARQFLNQKVTVTFKVQHAKAATDPQRVYLDSEKDYRDPANLGVLIEAAALPAFEKAGIAKPATHFEGKTIQITGQPFLRDDLVFISATRPEDIRIVKPAEKMPKP